MALAETEMRQPLWKVKMFETFFEMTTEGERGSFFIAFGSFSFSSSFSSADYLFSQCVDLIMSFFNFHSTFQFLASPFMAELESLNPFYHFKFTIFLYTPIVLLYMSSDDFRDLHGNSSSFWKVLASRICVLSRPLWTFCNCSCVCRCTNVNRICFETISHVFGWNSEWFSVFIWTCTALLLLGLKVSSPRKHKGRCNRFVIPKVIFVSKAEIQQLQFVAMPFFINNSIISWNSTNLIFK